MGGKLPSINNEGWESPFQKLLVTPSLRELVEVVPK
jgi:hypothetical protein